MVNDLPPDPDRTIASQKNGLSFEDENFELQEFDFQGDRLTQGVTSNIFQEMNTSAASRADPKDSELYKSKNVKPFKKLTAGFLNYLKSLLNKGGTKITSILGLKSTEKSSQSLQDNLEAKDGLKAHQSVIYTDTNAQNIHDAKHTQQKDHKSNLNESNGSDQVSAATHIDAYDDHALVAKADGILIDWMEEGSEKGKVHVLAPGQKLTPEQQKKIDDGKACHALHHHEKGIIVDEKHKEKLEGVDLADFKVSFDSGVPKELQDKMNKAFEKGPPKIEYVSSKDFERIMIRYEQAWENVKAQEAMKESATSSVKETGKAVEKLIRSIPKLVEGKKVREIDIDLRNQQKNTLGWFLFTAILALQSKANELKNQEERKRLAKLEQTLDKLHVLLQKIANDEIKKDYEAFQQLQEIFIGYQIEGIAKEFARKLQVAEETMDGHEAPWFAAELSGVMPDNPGLGRLAEAAAGGGRLKIFDLTPKEIRELQDSLLNMIEKVLSLQNSRS